MNELCCRHLGRNEKMQGELPFLEEHLPKSTLFDIGNERGL